MLIMKSMIAFFLDSNRFTEWRITSKLKCELLHTWSSQQMVLKSDFDNNNFAHKLRPKLPLMIARQFCEEWLLGEVLASSMWSRRQIIARKQVDIKYNLAKLYFEPERRRNTCLFRFFKFCFLHVFFADLPDVLRPNSQP